MPITYLQNPKVPTHKNHYVALCSPDKECSDEQKIKPVLPAFQLLFKSRHDIGSAASSRASSSVSMLPKVDQKTSLGQEAALVHKEVNLLPLLRTAQHKTPPQLSCLPFVQTKLTWPNTPNLLCKKRKQTTIDATVFKKKDSSNFLPTPVSRGIILPPITMPPSSELPVTHLKNPTCENITPPFCQ